MTRPFDLILFGATGFTGRLVAEVLQARLGAEKPQTRLGAQKPSAGASPLRWALAGRSLDKLQAVRKAIGAGDDLPLLVVDAADTKAVADLVGQTRLVITTVGPYQRYGEPLVAACAEAGTDYVDLCGEPAWMASMVHQWQATAEASGARIVFSCGFDSIPFDLGVVVLQQAALERFGTAMREVHSLVKVMKGAVSGGTVASALATFEDIAKRPDQALVMADPFALTPGFKGPAQLDPGDVASFDALAGLWTAPFVMATINTKNVHRTNALRGHPWGRDFVYVERFATGKGAKGQGLAHLLAAQARLQNGLLGFAPSRKLLQRVVLPSPGQGPGPAQREAGRYELLIVGSHPAGHQLRLRVKGKRDPGYGATSRLITESALCLLQDVNQQHTPGGVWTAGAAMGLALQRRLAEFADLHFTVDDAKAAA